MTSVNACLQQLSDRIGEVNYTRDFVDILTKLYTELPGIDLKQFESFNCIRASDSSNCQLDDFINVF